MDSGAAPPHPQLPSLHPFNSLKAPAPAYSNAIKSSPSLNPYISQTTPQALRSAI
jgi:hypothetical protein